MRQASSVEFNQCPRTFIWSLVPQASFGYRMIVDCFPSPSVSYQCWSEREEKEEEEEERRGRDSWSGGRGGPDAGKCHL